MAQGQRQQQTKAGRPVTNTPDALLDRLIRSAIDILSEQAADAEFSVTEVARRAGISKRTVYTVVASKEELIAHVIGRGAGVVMPLLDLPVATAADARAVLGRFLEEWVAFVCGPLAVGIYVMAIRERCRYPAIGAAYYRARSDQGLQQLAAWLERMQGKGFIAEGDPVMTADLALTMAAAERQRILALGIDASFTPEQLERRIAAVLQFVFGATPPA